jgi:hypothetical protein
VAPANEPAWAALPGVAEQTAGTLVGDRNEWAPRTAAEWRALGVDLLAPSRSAKRDPHPRGSAHLRQVRSRLDTVFGQLVDRTVVNRVWARDSWPIGSRLLCKVLLLHTLAILLNSDLVHPPPHLAQLVA